MQEITTDAAPESIGPYSQAIRDRNTIYVAGQGPVDPASGGIVSNNVQEQTKQTLENIKAILSSADASLNDIVKTTVFVTNMDEYSAINEIYGDYMTEPYPARSAIEVSRLPIDIIVEIEAVARVDA